MPIRRLVYQVAVGETPAFYDYCIGSVDRYCRRHGYDHVVQTDPILRIAPVKSCRSANALRLGYLPIFEKENVLSYLDRYDQVAVIDADVYVRDSAPDLFEDLGGAVFSAVLERDMPLTPAYREKVRKHSEGHFRPLADVDWDWNVDGAAFYNMGVMVMAAGIAEFVGASPAEFLRRPEFERFVNGEGAWRWSTDQSLLNWWVRKSGMPLGRLDWRWNAMYGAIRGEALREAHFLHFILAAKLSRGGAEIPDLVARL